MSRPSRMDGAAASPRALWLKVLQGKCSRRPVGSAPSWVGRSLWGIPCMGIPWRGTPLTGIPLGPIPFQGIPLRGVPFRRSPWKGIPLRGIPFRGTPFRGSPLKGIPFMGSPFIGSPFKGSSAYAATALNSTRPQHATTPWALIVALKNLAERLVVRCGCVAMMCSFGRVSLCACAGITIQTRCVSAHDCTAVATADLDHSQTIL